MKICTLYLISWLSLKLARNQNFLSNFDLFFDLYPECATTTYSSPQMSYDLRCLRLKGFIWRISNSYRYQITTYGRQVVLLFPKVAARVFRPALPWLPLIRLNPYTRPSPMLYNILIKPLPIWLTRLICNLLWLDSCLISYRFTL